MAERIDKQLKDNCFPPVVFLDGEWGVGKTHFVNNEFKKIVGDVEFHYISVFDVYSLESFKSKLISSYLTGREFSGRWFDNIIKPFQSIKYSDDGVSGSLGMAVGAFKDVIFEQALKKINGHCFVVDDLERVDSKTMRLIVALCFTLAEGNSVRFLLVGNKSKLDDENLDDVFEKVLSRSYSFSLGFLEIFDIAFSEVDLTGYEQEIKSILEKAEINNLRILKKSASLIQEVTTCKNLKNSGYLAKTVIAAVALNVWYSASSEQIREAAFSGSWLSKLSSEPTRLFAGKEVNDNDEEILKVLFGAIDKTHIEILKFSCGELVSASEISNMGFMPENETPLDKLLGKYIVFVDQETLDKAVVELFEYIGLDSVDYDRWCRCCTVADDLARRRYVEIPPDLEPLDKYIEDHGYAKEFQNMSFPFGYPEEPPSEGSDVDVALSKLAAKYGKSNFDKSINEFFDDVRKSFIKSESNFYAKTKTERLFKFRCADFYLSCITESWTHSDIMCFTNAIEKYGRISNFCTCDFGEDAQGIMDLSGKVNEYASTDLQVGFKEGAIRELANVLSEVVNIWPSKPDV
ncbi:MAG: hypothetical protein CMI09_13900 [Oceanospirillaceae bacterium]|nr:hypothetical protein [Oceanospirillaceae bacterium]